MNSEGGGFRAGDTVRVAPANQDDCEAVRLAGTIMKVRAHDTRLGQVVLVDNSYKQVRLRACDVERVKDGFMENGHV